ncbi:MAG: hypothetical protein KIT72_05080 [Polyangiaceae bacterium]|nr:hypothetical protein [Polyangiaceae bacterium]MCW5789777.1 hypothetical protein [Polyangiaceae bacterium]
MPSWVGCGDQEEVRTLVPQQVGMTADMEPVFEGDEFSLYEVKLAVRLPIRAATEGDMQRAWENPIAPFPHRPTVVPSDYRVQVTWVLTNLDDRPHAFEFLLDPWNEYGRYWPGMQVVDAQRGEVLPNLSGIDFHREIGPRSAGEASRMHGTLTYDDFDELAIDFATVMNIIETVPPPDPEDRNAMSPVTLVNHAFHIGNRSASSPLTRPFIPSIIPAITGFDIGIRTRQPANLALEFVVELSELNRDRDRVLDEGEPIERARPEPTQHITLGM